MSAVSKHNRSAYISGKCRCDECRAANTAYVKANAAKRLASGDYEHGVTAYFTYGCRCDECRAAGAAKARSIRVSSEPIK